MLVCASSVRTNSSRSTFEVRGSNTSRTAASLPDSSRTVSSTESTSCLVCCWSGVSAFLPALTFGLVSSSISSSTRWLEVDGGSSMHDQLPLPARQLLELEARTHLEAAAAAGVDLTYVAGRRDDLSAAREVRAGQPARSMSSSDAFGSASSSSVAAATSRRLCDGISVAMPTAMPDAPLSSTNGRRAGSSRGSCVDPS